MKKYTITKSNNDCFVMNGEDDMQVSDGYHTMDELYEHRIELFMSLCRLWTRNTVGDSPWKSIKHSDGSTYAGWFVLGIGKEQGKQITYHLPIAKWDECYFAETLEKAPEFDGHTSADVLERLKHL